MFCRKCGFKNDEDALFCGRCGEKLDLPTADFEEDTKTEETSESKKETSSEIYPKPKEEPDPAPLTKIKEEQSPSYSSKAEEEPSSVPPSSKVEKVSIEDSKLTGTTEGKALEQKKKIPIVFLLFLLLLLLLGSGGSWAYLRFFKKTTIPLDGYVKVNFHGPSGYAVADAEIDWDGIERDYGEKLSFTSLAKEDGIERLYDSPIAYLLDVISPPNLDQENNIENGEFIAYQWDLDDGDISRYLNCKLKFANKKVKAHTDASVKEEDIFRKMEIKLVGESGNAYMELSSLPEGLKEEDFVITPNYVLTNGSKVEISLRYNPIYYYEKAGIIPSKKAISYTVSGLTETAPSESATEAPTEAPPAPAPTAAAPPESVAEGVQIIASEYLCPYSSSRLITKQDMTGLMAQYPNYLFPGQRSVAQMIVNEMYARYGYEFKDEELKNYFEQYYWYSSIWYRNPNMDSIYPQMSAIEKKNVDFLKTYH